MGIFKNFMDGSRLFIGLMILVIDAFWWYYVHDIPREWINGRPAGQLAIEKLIMPILLFLLGIIALFGKKGQPSQEKKSDLEKSKFNSKK